MVLTLRRERAPTAQRDHLGGVGLIVVAFLFFFARFLAAVVGIEGGADRSVTRGETCSTGSRDVIATVDAHGAF